MYALSHSLIRGLVLCLFDSVTIETAVTALLRSVTVVTAGPESVTDVTSVTDMSRGLSVTFSVRVHCSTLIAPNSEPTKIS